MKLLLTLLTGLGLWACNPAHTNAQDMPPAQTDPTQSARNYKHANKAAAAAAQEADRGVRVRVPAVSGAGFASYKNQTPAQRPVGGVVVRHTPNEALANRNYKAQATGQGTRTTDVARKPEPKQRPATAIGE